MSLSKSYLKPSHIVSYQLGGTMVRLSSYNADFMACEDKNHLPLALYKNHLPFAVYVAVLPSQYLF